MAQFDNICTTCLEREVPSCFDILTFELGLEDGDYVFRFIDRYGTYQTLALESSDGVIESFAADAPSRPGIVGLDVKPVKPGVRSPRVRGYRWVIAG